MDKILKRLFEKYYRYKIEKEIKEKIISVKWTPEQEKELVKNIKEEIYSAIEENIQSVKKDLELSFFSIESTIDNAITEVEWEEQEQEEIRIKKQSIEEEMKKDLEEMEADVSELSKQDIEEEEIDEWSSIKENEDIICKKRQKECYICDHSIAHKKDLTCDTECGFDNEAECIPISIYQKKILKDRPDIPDACHNFCKTHNKVFLYKKGIQSCPECHGSVDKELDNSTKDIVETGGL